MWVLKIKQERMTKCFVTKFPPAIDFKPVPVIVIVSAASTIAGKKIKASIGK
jgi:hypothetical protein